MHRLTLLIFIPLLFFSCLGEGTQYIPEDFTPYVDEFFQEAQARGHDLKLEDYTISIIYRELRTTSPDNRIGECSRTGQHQIRIDPDYWARATEKERRLLMFHELGHCILLRDHRSVQDDRGLCFSIMNDGRVGRCERNINDDDWWNYLVDELFDETLTTASAWAALEVPYQESPGDSEVVWEQEGSALDFTFGIQDFPTEVLINQDFSLNLSVIFGESRPAVTMGIGDLNYAYCDCQFSAVDIGGRYANDLFTANFTVEEPAVLELQKRGDRVHFYLNERFLYSLDAAMIGDELLPKASHRNSSNYSGTPSFKFTIRTWQ